MTRYLKYGGFLMLLLFALSLTACGRDGGERDRFDPTTINLPEDLQASLEMGWTGVDQNIHAELTLKVWSPIGREFLRDVGRTAINPEEIDGLKAAAVVATAQVFNTHFPNVVVNVYSRTHTGSQLADRNAFHMEHGIRPNIFMVSSIPVEVELGTLANLCVFADDPVFDLFNPTIMQVLNLHGRIWAAPMYIVPQGYWVNRTMAENQNLDVPPVNWTMHDFDFFTRQFRMNEFYGAADFDFNIVDTGADGFWYQLVFRGPDDPFVNMDAQSVRSMLQFAPNLRPFSLAGQRAAGAVDAAWTAGRDNWALFAQGLLLTHHANHHMLDVAGSPVHPNRVQVPDWDHFPRPSTDWVGNHMGTIFDTMGIHNFAMENGDGILTPENYEMLKIAWEFVRFYTADIRAWHARNNFLFGSYGLAATNSGFPYVVGQLYWDLMDIWFDAEERAIFANPNRFPGMHYMMDLWEQGQFWRFTHNVFPWNESGGAGAISREWNARNPGGGVTIVNPNWLDEMLVRLPLWDDLFNARWEHRYAELYYQIWRWYR